MKDFVFSFRAIKAYLDEPERENVNGVEEMQLWIYHGFKATSDKNGQPAKSKEDILDWMNDNMDEAIELTQYCKAQFVKFRSAFETQEEKKPMPRKMKKVS